MIEDINARRTPAQILIVDDIPETVAHLSKLIGFEADLEVVASAATGLEAIEASERLRPDLILMDIMIPDMDGIEATAEIRRRLPEVRVVMMSVQGEADYLRRSMLAGASDFLVKPFSAEELFNAIRKTLAAEAPQIVPPAPERDAGRTVAISEKQALDRSAGHVVRRALTLGVGFLFVAYVMWYFIHDPACTFSSECLVPRSALSPPVTDRAIPAEGSALCGALISLGGNREDFQILKSTSNPNDAYAALDRMSTRTGRAVAALRAVGTGSVGTVARELASAEEGLLPILDGFRSMKNEADWATLTADYRRWFESTQSTTSRLGPRLVELGVVC